MDASPTSDLLAALSRLDGIERANHKLYARSPLGLGCCLVSLGLPRNVN